MLQRLTRNTTTQRTPTIIPSFSKTKQSQHRAQPKMQLTTENAAHDYTVDSRYCTVDSSQDCTVDFFFFSNCDQVVICTWSQLTEVGLVVGIFGFFSPLAVPGLSCFLDVTHRTSHCTQGCMYTFCSVNFMHTVHYVVAVAFSALHCTLSNSRTCLQHTILAEATGRSEYNNTCTMMPVCQLFRN